jgi:general secretion pathway protein L
MAVDPAGRYWLVRAHRAVPRASARRARALALEGEDCLWGEMHLPALPRRALPAAVAEALWRHAPMALPEMVYGWRAEPDAQGGWRVQWGLAARHRLAQAGQQAGAAASDRAPVFLLRGDTALLVDDGRAARRLRRWQRALSALGLLMLGLLLAAATVLAAMPAVLKRQGVVDAMQVLRELEPQAVTVRQQLEQLRALAQRLDALRAGIASAVPATDVLEALAGALPDDSMLDRIDINGREVRISGLTPNATELLSRVAKLPSVADAKAAQAAVRDNASGKERFTFELRWKGEGAP